VWIEKGEIVLSFRDGLSGFSEAEKYDTISNMDMLKHPFEPIYDAHSRLLILGTFPSPKSRASRFYYAHPQNRFWATLAAVLGEAPPAPDAAARTAFLLKNHIALWDVLHACEIEGASDGSIRNPVPNLFRPLLAASEIAAIFTTGKKATGLFNALCAAEAGMEAVYLPSTSPANRAYQQKPAFMAQWLRVRTALDARARTDAASPASPPRQRREAALLGQHLMDSERYLKIDQAVRDKADTERDQGIEESVRRDAAEKKHDDDLTQGMHDGDQE
jgi:hypoxanthine-DNA glycosylase